MFCSSHGSTRLGFLPTTIIVKSKFGYFSFIILRKVHACSHDVIPLWRIKYIFLSDVHISRSRCIRRLYFFCTSGKTFIQSGCITSLLAGFSSPRSRG